eukprot:c27326_g1_i1 orf=265-2217(+)
MRTVLARRTSHLLLPHLLRYECGGIRSFVSRSSIAIGEGRSHVRESLGRDGVEGLGRRRHDLGRWIHGGVHCCGFGQLRWLQAIRGLQTQGSGDELFDTVIENAQKWQASRQRWQESCEGDEVLNFLGNQGQSQTPGVDAETLSFSGRPEDGYQVSAQTTQDFTVQTEQDTQIGGEKLAFEEWEDRWKGFEEGAEIDCEHLLISPDKDQRLKNKAERSYRLSESRRVARQPEHPDRIIYPIGIPVKGRVTRKTKFIIKQIRSRAFAGNLKEILRRWVITMYPVRSDWIDLLEEFQTEKDREMWLQILDLALLEDTYEASIKDYLRLMLAYSKVDRNDDAQRVSKVMEERGLQPDIAVFIFLIDMHCKAGNPAKAEEVFNQMSFYELEPDATSCSSLTDAYCHVGKPEKAEFLLIEFERKYWPIKLESYVTIIRAFGKLGKAAEAERIFKMFVLREEEINHKLSYMLLNALMEAYALAHDLENAESVFETILYGNTEPEDESVAILIAAYEKKNLLDGAVSLLLKLEAKAMKPGAETLTVLIGWFGKLGLVYEAELLFEEIKRKNKKIQCKAYVPMYLLYERAGWLDKAREILSLEDKEILTDWGYEQIIQGLLAGGHFHEAQAMHREMQDQGYSPSAEMEMAFRRAQMSV